MLPGLATRTAAVAAISQLELNQELELSAKEIDGMDTIERLHLFSTRRTRERMKEAALRTERSSVESAKIADFQAGQLALREVAAAMSPAEKSEAQGNSTAERRKSTPAV